MTSPDRKGIQDGPARRVKDVSAISEVVNDDQDCVALLVAVILVVLGNCESGVYYLLHLLAVPVVEEVFILLLVELVAYIFLEGTPGPIVMNRRTEHIYS